MLLLLHDYYYEKETISLYLKYNYLRTSDTVLILKSLEGLYTDILKSIGIYNVNYDGEQISFVLTIDEIHTGNSIDFKFGKKWVKTKKIKKIETVVEKQFEVTFSLGLKEVIAFLLVFGVINSPSENINSVSDVDKHKFEVIQDSLKNNNIWYQLQNTPKETYIGIEKKARDLTYFFMQNPTFKDVEIDGICIKKSGQNNF